MQCRKQPRFLEDKGIHISDLLEVRLAPIHWNRIKLTAWQRRRTYSTITRYCVLRLARKCALRWTPKLNRAKDGVRHGLGMARKMHRHMLCLYGADVKLIRLAAMELGLTISAFVRLAIELYLDSLAMEKRSQRAILSTNLTYEGIRIIETLQIFATNNADRPLSRNMTCLCYAVDSYW